MVRGLRSGKADEDRATALQDGGEGEDRGQACGDRHRFAPLVFAAKVSLAAFTGTLEHLSAWTYEFEKDGADPP